MNMKKTKIGSILSIHIFLYVLLIFSGCGQDTSDKILYEVKDSNKTHFIIVSDTHLNSPFALELNIENIPKGDNTLYLGDIYEVVWAKTKEVEYVVQKVKQLRKKVGDNYIRGNHEGNAFHLFLPPPKKTAKIQNEGKEIILTELDYAIRSVKNNDILFVHGHKGIDPDYDVKKIKELEEMKGGRGLFFQFFIKIIAWIRGIFPNTPSEQEIRNAIHLATTMNCQTIVFGHTHVKDLFDKKYKDDRTGKIIRVINVPRGITHLEL